MVFWLNAKILEYGVRPESLHVILRMLDHRRPLGIARLYPVLNLSMSDWVVYTIT
jgi:hypothetical protein